MGVKKLSGLLSGISIQKASTELRLTRYSLDICAAATVCVHACSSQRSLTVVRDQALSRPKQQVNLTASRLDQFNSPRVCDALGGLAVDLHDLIPNLWGRRMDV